MNEVPCHLGIIMDGNRRWAKERGLPSFAGHKKGAENIERIVRHCKSRGIKILTLYAFSTENWEREAKEVNFLMHLGSMFLTQKLQAFQQEKVRLLIIGQREKLPHYIQEKIKKAENLTKDNEDFILIGAISYGGRAEIIEAVKKIIGKGLCITEENIACHLYTSGLPDPDLIIRTSGEIRTSGFLMWQSAYSELYFTEKYWPDFSGQDIDEALAEYSKRQRRFGK